MGEKHKLQAQKRTLFGKKVKQLRHANQVIGNVSVPGEDSISLQVSAKDFKVLYDQVGESTLIYLQVADEKAERPVLLEEVQIDPLSDSVVHVSFRQVSLKNKVEAEVAIEFVGEVDIRESVVVTVRDAVEVEALPTDLPEKITVDISVLTEIGQSISLADLPIDKSKVTLVLGEDQDPAQMPVVLIQEQKEEIEEETPAEGEDGEAQADSSVGNETKADSNQDDQGKSDSDDSKNE